MDWKPTASAVVFDIDGVLCDSGEEIAAHLEANPQVAHTPWETMVGGSAPPRQEYVRLLDLLLPEIQIHLVTNRNEAHRTDTILWLKKHGVRWHALHMWDPSVGYDYHGHKEAVVRYLMQVYRVLLAVEDSHAHCNMYRSFNIPTMHVSGGFSG